MHGSLLHGFKQFVVAQHGKVAWNVIAQAAGTRSSYLITDQYPDEEFVALVRATADRSGTTMAALLEEFGAALVPTLLTLYGSFVNPAWRTLALLVNTERVMHKTIRMRDPEAKPPHLSARRVSDREVHIEYASKRRLCALAIGICKGVAAHYKETVTVEQPECMERGDAACRLIVRLVSE
jgi:predicted hydrocarbon binding protein